MADEEEELYDEFGNYIGPDLDSSDDDDSDDDASSQGGGAENQAAPDDASDVSGDDDDHDGGAAAADGVGDGAMVLADEGNTMTATLAEPMNAIVLHEDKEHYLSAKETYGEEVRTAVLDEDAMDLETPIVEPVSNKTHRSTSALVSEENLEWIYTEEYLTKTILSNETTKTRRGIAIVGHLHHGKTSLIDFLLETTLRNKHQKNGGWGPRASLDMNSGGGPRFTDILKSEQERQLSLISTPLSALFSDTRSKTYCLTLLDCPGHVQFHDESVASLKVCDGVVLVVDAVEGIMMHTEMLIKHAVTEGLPITLLISKMDRLIVELKLPPRDAYYKLLHIIEQTNNIIGKASRGRYPKLSPQRGNVAFASCQHGWLFTLQSMAQVYFDHKGDDKHGLGENLSIEEFALRLWGDCYFDDETRTFHKSPSDFATPRRGVQRTFVEFCLQPLYKIYTACVGERETDVNKLLRSLGVLLKKEELRSSARPLLRTALSKFMETASCGFVDMVIQHM